MILSLSLFIYLLWCFNVVGSLLSALDVYLISLTQVPLEQVVIMLVIDRENDRALLSRQSRFVPRMWSCLAGFIEVCTLANFRSISCFRYL